jgi:hypothetical protein
VRSHIGIDIDRLAVVGMLLLLLLLLLAVRFIVEG